jgi:thiosulfate dehydrogenase [quinone] large subunit
MMLQKPTRYLLAALQGIIGWEWLMSGGDKLLAGTFPQGLGAALANGIDGNPNGWYVNFLQSYVLPHSIFFGYLVEWTEVVVGIILLTGAFILLGQPRRRGEQQHGLMVGYSIAAIIASLLSIIMSINFHFWLGGWVIPVFNSATLYNEAIDLEGLLPPLSLAIIIAHLYLLRALQGERLLAPLFRRLHRVNYVVNENQ